MDPAARLLRLLSLLEARPSWPGTELAERLGVTPRTVRRDVARLRELGYPVDSDPEGYQLGIGGRLPPLLLDDDEAVAVCVGLRFASASAVSGAEESAVAALAKLEQLMAPVLRERVRDLQAASVHLRTSRLPQVNPETLVVLARGCRAREGIKFAYEDYHGRRSARFVEPLQTVHSAGRWYLVARDRDRADWRTFRVDRISEATLSGHRFEILDPPDPNEMVKEAAQAFAFRIEAKLLLELSAADARASLPAGLGVIEEGPHHRAVLRTGANELAALVRFVAGLPVDVEVLEPTELRRAVAELGERLSKRNARPGSRRSAPRGQDRSRSLRTVVASSIEGGPMRMQTPRLFGVTIHAEEVEETAGFYREVVGLELCGERHGEGPLHYHAGWGFPDSGLMFSLFPGVSKEVQHLAFLVDDLDAAHGRARQRGAQIERAPGKNDEGSPSGWKDCVMRDPAGNLVALYQAG
ncbi:MAG: WYL domain-containing protein [Acidimicrobiales bacterium]|nr:WYL domain-containing protein [Acidimicrobiales bacterium]MBO0887087.1 WYL domain-containing protein [Acidimicrobiales bacterium]